MNPSKNHVFSVQLLHRRSNWDETDSLIQVLANVTVLKRIVDKNKSAEELTKPRHYEIDSSFYFTVDLIAVV
jgi:hypothetical protein